MALVSQNILDALLNSVKLSRKVKGKQREVPANDDDVLVLPGANAMYGPFAFGLVLRIVSHVLVRQLPVLDPGPSTPIPYFVVKDGLPALSDEYIASTEAAASLVPAPPEDKSLSKRERKEARHFAPPFQRHN
jgi:hypothetical protein